MSTSFGSANTSSYWNVYSVVAVSRAAHWPLRSPLLVFGCLSDTVTLSLSDGILVSPTARATACARARTLVSTHPRFCTGFSGGGEGDGDGDGFEYSRSNL